MFSRYSVFIGLALIAVVLLTDSVKADEEQDQRTAKCRVLVKEHVDLKREHLLLEEAIALCDMLCLNEGATDEENVACVRYKMSSNDI